MCSKGNSNIVHDAALDLNPVGTDPLIAPAFERGRRSVEKPRRLGRINKLWELNDPRGLAFEGHATRPCENVSKVMNANGAK